MEAMKMEHTPSTRRATAWSAELLYAVGDQLTDGADCCVRQ